MFTYPFRYAPSPETVEAAKALAARIDASPRLRRIFSEGKMLGVLLCSASCLPTGAC